MDSSDFEVHLKSQKSTAHVFRYYHYGRHLRGFRTAFRAVEFLAALLLFLWMFTHLPIAVQISAAFFRRLATVIESPPFVFLICNAIIVTLIVKPGRFASENPAEAKNADDDLYGEILKNAESSFQKTIPELPLHTPLPDAAEPETDTADVFEDKEIIVSPIKSIAPHQVGACETEDADSKSDDVVFYSSESESDEVEGKVFRRTRSENLQRRRGEKKKLQRSETEKSWKAMKSREEREEEELSDEEFQRAVEEFIAKNLRLRRQETLGVVPRSSVAQFELRSEIVIN